MTLAAVIKRYWGYDGFLPLQEEAMASVLEGRDSVVVLPTGGGKSLCFQAPAMLVDGLAVVVSPLISLMKDQVDSLTACGVPAACLNSSLTPEERDRTVARIRAGELKLLYVAPERLVSPGFLEFLRRWRVAFFAIDEAHCISHWGHDFRPEYRALRVLKETFDGVAVHAYTATATERVRADIVDELSLREPNLLVGSFDRPNLHYRAARRQSGNGGLTQLEELLRRHRSESGIIYCITRKAVDTLCARLGAKGYRVAPYHAGLSDDERRRNQDAFRTDEVDVIVATVAFGMGIDKSNVRYVVHMGMPKSLECYQQESGRAGRDGLEAECLLLFGPGDYATWLRILEGPEAQESDVVRGKLNDMYSYATGVRCRHRTLVGYFGQELAADNCGACDVCLEEIELVPDALVLGQKIVSCVLRLQEQFGAQYTAAVLNGSTMERIIESGHDRLSTYGLLAEHTERQIRDWIEQLIGQGFLAREGEYNLVRATPKGWGLIRGEQTPQLLKPAPPPARAEKRSGKNLASWEGVDRELFETLRAKRFDIAQAKHVPAYVVLSDATLRDLARERPTTREGFLRMYGIGERKCEEYAGVFLPLIAEWCREHGFGQDVSVTAAEPPVMF